MQFWISAVCFFYNAYMYDDCVSVFITHISELDI